MLKDSYERRRKMFNHPIRRLPKASLKMAMIPRGATALYNSVGSAAGVLLKVGNTTIASLPGVPSEMKAIFTEELVPRIQETSSKFINAEEWLELVGTSESRISTPVARISKKYSPLLYVKSHPMGFENGKSIIHVQLILTSKAQDKEKSVSAAGKSGFRDDYCCEKIRRDSKDHKISTMIRRWDVEGASFFPFHICRI